LRFLILDEADRMLDMGFNEDIMRIISYLPEKRQNMLFSATMPNEIRGLAKKILTNPVEISIAVSQPAEGVKQSAYVVFEDQKSKIVRHIIDSNDFKSILIFCSTKSSTKQLSSELKRSRYSVQEIHSDLDQSARENALLKFKSKQLNILVATDILSRGIDIEDIDLVLNYDVPNDGEDYIHRIGRTARAASKGLAITLISSPKEQKKFAVIEKLLGKPVNKELLPSQIGKGPEYNPDFKEKIRRPFNKRK
jgi:ATP-dependent RNA helicase RhlE